MSYNTGVEKAAAKSIMKRKSKRNGLIERNIEARSDGYSFRVRMKINDTYINETFFTLEEARSYRDLLRAGKSTDHLQERVLRAKAEKKLTNTVTIGKFLERYGVEITPTKKGCKEEMYRIGKLLRHQKFSNMPANLVDAEAIDKLKDCLALTVSSSTVRKYMMLLSHLFRVAINKRWLRDLQNPIKAIELPRASASRGRRLETNELDFLLTELRCARNKLMLPFFEFLIETACRRGEALNLRFSDIDFSSRTMILRHTKNGDDRVVALSTSALNILQDRRNSVQQCMIATKVKDSQKVFPLKVHNIRSAFESAILRAQKNYQKECLRKGEVPKANFLKDFRLHDCRREATSRLFEKGLDIMEVSSMTGHKTLSMLQIYTRLRAADIARKLI